MKRKFKILSLILVLVLILTTLTPLITSVKAEETTGSLTINKKESKTPNDPIEGVTFTIYKVEDDYEDLSIPEDYTGYEEKVSDNKYGKLYKATDITDDQGQATFEDLPLGRYLVIEEDAPAKVPERTANFLIDIPRTEDDGQTLTYNVIVNPKNTIILEDYEIEKQDRKTGTTIDGVTFKLQKKTTGDSYVDYDALATVVTADGGKAGWKNLPVGEYQIVETQAASGYILDSKKTYKFEVYYEHGESGIRVIDEKENKTTYSKESPTVIKNEKPDLEKTIVQESNTGNNVEFKLKIDVPTTIKDLKSFKVTDTMSEGLKYVADSLEISGVVLTPSTDYEITTESDNKITINFTSSGKEKLQNLYDEVTESTTVKQIEITYKAYILNGKKSSADPYKNSASLTYSSKTEVSSEETSDSTSEVTPDVGGFKIKKIDSRSNVELAGAKFKIALTEDDAKSKTYLKDDKGIEIELTSAETTGLAEYYGLTYGTYYLVEVEAPLAPDGTRYNLLRKPQEIVINASSYDGEIQVKNRKGLVLPLTGGMGTVLIFGLGLAFISTAVIVHKKGKENK